MPYRLPNPAMKAGSWARNHATAPRRALLTLWWSDAGLIGNSADRSSSEASREAISRRNFSPFFGPAVAMNDWIATRINTASADGAGKSPAADCGSFTDNKTLTHHCAEPVVATVSNQPSRSLAFRARNITHRNYVGVQTPALDESRQTDTSDCASCPSVTPASDIPHPATDILCRGGSI